MSRIGFTLLALVFPLLAYAVGDECVNEKSEELKLMCKAKNHASAGYCDKMSSLGSRMECVLVVRNRQREINWAAPKPKVLPPPIQN